MRDDGPTADEPKAYSGGEEAGSSRSNPCILGADPAFIILCLPLSGFQPYVGMRYEASYVHYTTYSGFSQGWAHFDTLEREMRFLMSKSSKLL